MAAYFASDVHLRLDRPDRARRFAPWVSSLDAGDRLIVVGDLCDFWFSSRQAHLRPVRCPALLALADFTSRGGRLTVILGNHDTWLGPFYEESLGAEVISAPWALLHLHGQRVLASHGHLAGARSPWKGLMEGRAFRRGFAAIPGPVARVLETALDGSNDRRRTSSDRRHLAAYRAFADDRADQADLFVFGHIHLHHDDPSRSPRLVVLGDWLRGSSILRLDGRGLAFFGDRAASPTPVGSGPATHPREA